MDQDIKDLIGLAVKVNLLVIAMPFVFAWCVLDGVWTWITTNLKCC